VREPERASQSSEDRERERERERERGREREIRRRISGERNRLLAEFPPL